jgi:hypothetical protein
MFAASVFDPDKPVTWCVINMNGLARESKSSVDDTAARTKSSSPVARKEN